MDDNGSGTATLPPEGCDYMSPEDVHMAIDGEIVSLVGQLATQFVADPDFSSLTITARAHELRPLRSPPEPRGACAVGLLTFMKTGG